MSKIQPKLYKQTMLITAYAFVVSLFIAPYSIAQGYEYPNAPSIKPIGEEYDDDDYTYEFTYEKKEQQATIQPQQTTTQLTPFQARRTTESSIRFLMTPQQSATISVEMDGRITQLLKPGSRFHEGDIIVAQECALYNAELGISKADQRAAELKMKTNQALSRRNAISRYELKVSEIEYDKTKEGVKRAVAVVDKCKIKAPFDGQVAQTFTKRHEQASAGEHAIEIFDDTKFELTMIVPSSWLKWMKIGLVFDTIIDETNETHTAKITKIGSRIDAVSKTVSISAAYPTPPQNLIYGMSGVALLNP